MPPGTSSRTIGRGLRLAGLDQRERLERLVERAEAAGEEREPVGLLHERELAGEEVAEVHELRVAGEELLVVASNGSRMLTPNALLRPRALDAGLHDPGAGAR